MSDYNPTRHAQGLAAAKFELETTVAEERLRGMVAVVERLEGGLKSALADLENGRVLVGTLVGGTDQVSYLHATYLAMKLCSPKTYFSRNRPRSRA